MIGIRKEHVTRASVAGRFGGMDVSETKRRLAEGMLDNGAHRKAASGRAAGGAQQDDCRAVFVATPAPLGCPSADKMGLRLSAGTLGSLGDLLHQSHQGCAVILVRRPECGNTGSAVRAFCVERPVAGPVEEDAWFYPDQPCIRDEMPGNSSSVSGVAPVGSSNCSVIARNRACFRG